METQTIIAEQAKKIIDASEKKINSEKLANLIHCLINDLPLKIDASVVETAICQVMKNTGISFKPYFTLLEEAEEKYMITPFDCTADFFFDEVLKPNVQIGRIRYLLELTVKF